VPDPSVDNGTLEDMIPDGTDNGMNGDNGSSGARKFAR
jgi:hypothetical protein